MSLSTQIRNMINTPSDSQLLSIRLSTITVNQLEELAQLLNKTRTELITTFIEGGLIELENQLTEQAPEAKVIKSQVTSSDDACYFLLNTNFNNCAEDHYAMLENGEASAFYTGWKENVEHLNEGDFVFLYQSGVGIVGYGKANNDLQIRDHKGHKDEWYSRKLNDFVRLKTPLSAKGCKDTTKSNLNFRLTMVSLSPEQGKALLDKLD
ncbi:hypothetical protein JEU11_13680 [Paraglaciecola chathamensis]|uniref:EVE domain-containing protein n=1 Tax=Paraglaciecola chathamensis TaxID=368405 RepID=A0ABS0WGA3_9ALTE|nr:hypothetical protein [Paraglaciecola chathamensis]MBJ2137506.1 hypothetical protein [Paraglaciecola chathamensis]MDO6841339.1 hypothetical protein [Paraglaciecola chathamensis]